MLSRHIAVFVVFLLQFWNSNAAPEVTLPNGVIRGREDVTLKNVTYYAFEKIPYAAPPIGELRFQPPQPALSWEDTLDTSGFLDVGCYQQNSNQDWETEDCLFLNVFTPELPASDSKPNLPVMLFIHGGAFLGGSAMDFHSDPIMEQGVILIAINYRLGPFGFLSTQDEVIPGNNGLKDQQFAIQWVHDNIALFGGNPDQITIFGQSAGSASVAYQLLNQNTKDLIVGAILESGSALSSFAYQRNSRQIAFATGSAINNTFRQNNDSNDLLSVLLSVDAKSIDTASEQSFDNNDQLWQGFYYAPVIEVKNPSAFITKKMYGLVQAGNTIRVPILIGFNSEEAIAFYPDPESFQSYMTYVDTYAIGNLVPNDMLITDLTEKKSLGEQIRDFYTGGVSLESDLGDALRYSSDTSITRSVIKFAELYSQFGRTYFYQFSYNGKLGGNKTLYEGAESVGHSEELPYLFCMSTGCDHSNLPEADQVTSDRLVKIWTNFAKTKNPTPEEDELLGNISWPVLDTISGDFLYVDIHEELEIKNHPKEESYKFWNELYDGLESSDFDTY